ncbi:MAG TPA: hypothetical protein VE083_00190, partial [Terriglobales bacterium]|nr:hypothetical protein [Terriglobales bacterium]
MPPSLLMNRQRNALAVLTLRTRAAFISLPPLSDDTAVSFAPAGARANYAVDFTVAPLRGYFEASLGGFSHATHYYYYFLDRDLLPVSVSADWYCRTVHLLYSYHTTFYAPRNHRISA